MHTNVRTVMHISNIPNNDSACVSIMVPSYVKVVLLCIYVFICPTDLAAGCTEIFSFQKINLWYGV